MTRAPCLNRTQALNHTSRAWPVAAEERTDLGKLIFAAVLLLLALVVAR